MAGVICLGVVVDIAANMRRVIAAAVIIGIIIVAGTRADRQVYRYAVTTIFDLDQLLTDAFARIRKGLSNGRGLGCGRYSKEAAPPPSKPSE